MPKKKPVTFKTTKRKPRAIHVDFENSRINIRKPAPRQKKKEEVCTKAVSCQKCPDYEVGDPFGSCKRFGYGVGKDLAKSQAACK